MGVGESGLGTGGVVKVFPYAAIMARTRLRLQRSPPSPTNTGEQRLIKHAFPPFLCLWEKKTNIAAIPAVGTKDMHCRHPCCGNKRNALPPLLLENKRHALPPLLLENKRHALPPLLLENKKHPPFREGFLQSHERSYIVETKKHRSKASKH